MPQQEDDAKTRTHWAGDQTILANERTFSSWMSMGLAPVGIANGFNAVFGAAEPTWLAKLVATLFLAIAILVYWLARSQARKTLVRLRERDARGHACAQLHTAGRTDALCRGGGRCGPLVPLRAVYAPRATP